MEVDITKMTEGEFKKDSKDLIIKSLNWFAFAAFIFELLGIFISIGTAIGCMDAGPPQCGGGGISFTMIAILGFINLIIIITYSILETIQKKKTSSLHLVLTIAMLLLSVFLTIGLFFGGTHPLIN